MQKKNTQINKSQANGGKRKANNKNWKQKTDSWLK